MYYTFIVYLNNCHYRLLIKSVQVIDPHLGESGEVIANIPIRITAKSVFSR